jgi:predicted Zn-dependent peptidase
MVLEKILDLFLMLISSLLYDRYFREFTARNYVSENFVVSAVGNVNHDEVSQLVSKAFSKVPKGSSERVNGSKPYFTPSTL